MKAIVLNSYGAAEDMTFQDTAMPSPFAGQVLVKIYATAVNHIDIGKAAGAFKKVMPLHFPWIPGYDFAGVIESVGDDVKDFKAGDEVYGASLTDGAYAEYIAISPRNMALKPNSLSFTESASVPVSAETAWQVLFHHAKVKSKQTILVHGAAGAVGTYVVQLAHQSGVKVLVTASEADRTLLEKLGADEVIDDTSTPFEESVHQIDAVIDLVGGAIQQRSYAVLKEGGTLVSVNQPVSEALAEQYKITGIFAQLQPSQDGLSRIAGLIDDGTLTIHMGPVYPLQQAAEAWNVLQGKAINGRNRRKGRIVLQVFI